MSSDIHVFYHITQINNWELLVQEQIHSMCLSGLVRECDGFHVGINGDMSIPYLPKKASNTYHAPQEWREETPTLRMLKDFCESNPGKKILYIHSKGVTRNNLTHNCWRLYMEYFCVHKWRDCVADLDTHDCAGCLWVSQNQIPVFPPGSRPSTHYPPHFSGTFWWTNSDYVCRLDHSLLNTAERTDREFWIGSANPKVKAYKKDCSPEYGGWFHGSNLLLSEDYAE